MAPSTMTWGNLQADVELMGTSKYRHLPSLSEIEIAPMHVDGL